MSKAVSAAQSSRAVGQQSESLAVSHLSQLGYHIIARNVYSPYGEIDVIAWHDDVLCFIEIRSRASSMHGDPLETIGATKQRRIIRSAWYFLENSMQHWPESMRFDVVGVYLDETPPRFAVLQGAFVA